jgi:hypothetical protein
MNGRPRFGSWMLDNWALMTLPLAVLLLCSLPIFLTAENMSLILPYTMLPVYMIHQYEEHAHGRFVAFVNSVVGKGHEVLTKVFAFWINILDVWLVFLMSFYLAKYVAIGFALVPIYLTILNAVTHVIAGVVLRRYNPGLYTSLVLFFPWGAFLPVVCWGRIYGLGWLEKGLLRVSEIRLNPAITWGLLEHDQALSPHSTNHRY